MYTLKKVGVESVDVLVSLWAETFTQAYDDVHSPENIRTYCAKNYSVAEANTVLSSDQCDCIIAYRENTPVGYYLLNHQPCPTSLDSESWELKQIYLLSSEYGNGLGKMLFEHAVEIAQRAGCRWLWLCVSNANHRAQKFYNKLHFKAISPGPILEVGTDPLPSTIMVLQLGESCFEDIV